MALRPLLLQVSILETDCSDTLKVCWTQPTVNMLVLIILLNLFLIPPFIELSSAPLLLKSEQLWDGPGKMRSSLTMKATLVSLMDFGIFLVVFGKIFVTPLWISSMRTPIIALALS
eukprot:5085017-Amphidinium_carterae.2